MHFMGELTQAPLGESRSITAENPTGAPGSGGKAAGPLGPGRKGSASIPLQPGECRTLADITGSGLIRHIWITVPTQTEEDWFVYRDLVLRMYWDGEENPSVEAPLGDFFLCGFGTYYEVNALPIAVYPSGGLNCWLPMPFGKSARITVSNEHPGVVFPFFYQIDYELNYPHPNEFLHFHAQYRRENPTQLGRDYTIVDGVKGKGKYIGTFLAITALFRYWWGEGEVKFFIDGDGEYPTICGTGAEDYFGGAWASKRRQSDGTVREVNYSGPLMGLPYINVNDATRPDRFDAMMPPCRAMYRWHLPDPINFHKELRVTLQQIGFDAKHYFERSDDISTVAYWYQSEPHVPFGAFPDRMARRPR
jgi:hypothetical protein